MKKVTIEVNSKDIKKGVGGDCNMCPIALAVNRATKDIISTPILIAQSFAFIETLSDAELIMYSVELPDIATQFIRDFDKGEEVKPIIFELSLDNFKIKPRK